MVHKKSEYSLQFHILANELRKKIWQDNVKCRDSLRSTNQADHYWKYQVTNEYECDCDRNVEEDNNSILPLPPHRVKHKELLAKYEGYHQAKVDGLKWSNDIACNVPVTKHTHKPFQVLEEASERPIDREIGVQTPNWKDDSSQELADLEKNLSLTSVSAGELPTADQVIPFRPLSPIPPRSAVPPIIPAGVIHNQPIVGDLVAKSVGRPGFSAVSHTSSIHKLTRTNRRAYFEDKPSPFESYGWNDSATSIGGKKTYNIHASENEVYKHALNALRKRREETKRYLDEEADQRRRALKSSSVNSVAVNLSSIWQTEYQRNFSKNKREVNKFEEKLPRPKSALSRPCWWRGGGQ